MTNNDITFFAETNFRNQRKKFGIKIKDRRQHMYVIGQTGTGKTTLLMNMIISDIRAGNGVGFIDPHGDNAENILNYVPKERINDVIYFNPADMDYPIAFNAIEKVDEEKRHLVASGLMGVFKKIWPDVWSARMEYILNNTILALLEVPGMTLLGVNRMFSDKLFRKNIVSQLKDPVIKTFWTQEYASYQQRYEQEATAAIQNKIGQFGAAAVIRNIIGQPHSAFDFRKAMDEGKIIIMNLSKGRIGEDNSKLLGGMLVTKLYLAALSRVDIPEEKRKDFYLYVDEFQNFVTDSFAAILSEARKYRLDLIIANQYIGQLVHDQNVKVKDAVFGNVGTFVAFRTGGEDVEFLEEKQFGPDIIASDLLNLPNYNIYLRLMIDSVPSRPFSALTLPPEPRPEVSYANEIIEFSRKYYATPRAEVEKAIAEASGLTPVTAEVLPEIKTAPEAKAMPEAKTTPAEIAKPSFAKASEGKQVIMYDAVCSNCNKTIKVPFKPDPSRPVYCKDCFTESRNKPAATTPPSARKESRPLSLSKLKPRERISPPVSAKSSHLSSTMEKVKRERKSVDTEGLKKILEEAVGNPLDSASQAAPEAKESLSLKSLKIKEGHPSSANPSPKATELHSKASEGTAKKINPGEKIKL